MYILYWLYTTFIQQDGIKIIGMVDRVRCDAMYINIISLFCHCKHVEPIKAWRTQHSGVYCLSIHLPSTQHDASCISWGFNNGPGEKSEDQRSWIYFKSTCANKEPWASRPHRAGEDQEHWWSGCNIRNTQRTCCVGKGRWDTASKSQCGTEPWWLVEL